MSANDNDEAGGCAQISWHLPYGCGKPRKTSARRPPDEDCAIGHSSDTIPLPANDVGRIVQHVAEGQERNGWHTFLISSFVKFNITSEI